MQRPSRADLKIAICLYLQTILVAPALTVVVSDDGRVTVETESAHAEKWHAAPATGPESSGIGASETALADRPLGHRHFRFAESDSLRSEAAAATHVACAPAPAPAPPLPVALPTARGCLRRRGEPPPDAPHAAAWAAFDEVSLTI